MAVHSAGVATCATLQTGLGNFGRPVRPCERRRHGCVLRRTRHVRERQPRRLYTLAVQHLQRRRRRADVSAKSDDLLGGVRPHKPVTDQRLPERAIALFQSRPVVAGPLIEACCRPAHFLADDHVARAQLPQGIVHIGNECLEQQALERVG